MTQIGTKPGVLPFKTYFIYKKLTPKPWKKILGYAPAHKIPKFKRNFHNKNYPLQWNSKEFPILHKKQLRQLSILVVLENNEKNIFTYFTHFLFTINRSPSITFSFPFSVRQKQAKDVEPNWRHFSICIS